MHPAGHPSPFPGYRARSPAPEVQDRQGQQHLNRAATPSSIHMTLYPALTSTGMAQPRSPQHLPFSASSRLPPTLGPLSPRRTRPPHKVPLAALHPGTNLHVRDATKAPTGPDTGPTLEKTAREQETHRRRRNTEAPFPESLFVTSPRTRLHFPQFSASKFHEAKEGNLKRS